MDQQEIIVITAGPAGRWVRKRLPSPSKLVRWLGEGMFGDYAEKMELLREVDDRIQEWVDDFKTIGKKLDKAVKADRILEAAILLRQVDIRFKKIQQEGKRIKDVSEKALVEYESNLPGKGVHLPSDLGVKVLKEAGIWDNLKRKWLSSRLEDSAGFRKERKLALQTLVKDIELITKTVQYYLREMESSRHSGKIGKYVSNLAKVEEQQGRFLAKYQPIHDKYLKAYLERHDEDVKKKEEEERELIRLQKKKQEEALARSLEEHQQAMKDQEPPSSESPMAPPAPPAPLTVDDPNAPLMGAPPTVPSFAPLIGAPPTAPPFEPTIREDAPTYREPKAVIGNPKNSDEIEHAETTPLPGIITPLEQASGNHPSSYKANMVNLFGDEQYSNEEDESPGTSANAYTPGGTQISQIASDQDFIKSLILKYAENKNTSDIAQEILRYSAQIEAEDPETCDLLLAIVERANC